MTKAQKFSAVSITATEDSHIMVSIMDLVVFMTETRIVAIVARI